MLIYSGTDITGNLDPALFMNAYTSDPDVDEQFKLKVFASPRNRETLFSVLMLKRTIKAHLAKNIQLFMECISRSVFPIN